MIMYSLCSAGPMEAKWFLGVMADGPLLQSKFVPCTVQQNMIWTIRSVWSNMGIFKWVFCYVIALPCSCQPVMFKKLMRPFKWGTAWSSISRGIKNTSSQTFGYPSLLNKVVYFLQLLTLTCCNFDAPWDKTSCSASYERSYEMVKYIW